MKTGIQTVPGKNRPPHFRFNAFCLAGRDQTTRFLKLIRAGKARHWSCPAKQKRALLESNPPRDNWIERRRNEIVSTFGEAKTSPKAIGETFISEPEHAFQNSSKTFSKSSKSFLRNGQQQQKTLTKTYLSSYPFFRSKRRFRAPRVNAGNRRQPQVSAGNRN
jgi:hypothetical protein